MHVTAPPFAHASGPRNAKIALVGESFGENEDKLGRPFVGASGQLLNDLLRKSGIDRSECFVTNVLALRPYKFSEDGIKLPSNNFKLLCGSKAEVGKDYPLPAIELGTYLRPEFFGELLRLYEELEIVSPNIVVPLGKLACWALLGTPKISEIRGTVCMTRIQYKKFLIEKYLQNPCAERYDEIKAVGTYHPSYLFNVYSARPIVLADFEKVREESQFPEIKKPSRKLVLQATLAELQDFTKRVLAGEFTRLAIDIETKLGQITRMSFASSPSFGVCFPFAKENDVGNYWKDELDEVIVWELVGAILASPVAKVFQNGVYDLTYLLRYGFSVRNCLHDTMLLHHAHYPELLKGLGFLGSIYGQSGQGAWKAQRGKRAQVKRDE